MSSVLRIRVFTHNLSSSHAGHRLAKDCRRAWRRRERGLEDPFELDERFFEKPDVVDILRTTYRRGRDRTGSRAAETEVVLDARKALLFRRGHEQAILKQRRCGVVEVAGNAQDVHVYLPLVAAGGNESLFHVARERGGLTLDAEVT